MEKEYKDFNKIIWAENPEGYDCLHSSESDKKLLNSQIEEKVSQEKIL